METYFFQQAVPRVIIVYLSFVNKGCKMKVVLQSQILSLPQKRNLINSCVEHVVVNYTFKLWIVSWKHVDTVKRLKLFKATGQFDFLVCPDNPLEN